MLPVLGNPSDHTLACVLRATVREGSNIVQGWQKRTATVTARSIVQTDSSRGLSSKLDSVRQDASSLHYFDASRCKHSRKFPRPELLLYALEAAQTFTAN